MKVLIVDDAAVVQMVLEKALRHAGHDVVGTTDSGERALALVEETRPDIVILDLRLPDGNGLDVLREMKRRHPGVRIAVHSAVCLKETVEQAMAAGAFVYLRKPIAPPALLDALGAPG